MQRALVLVLGGLLLFGCRTGSGNGSRGSRTEPQLSVERAGEEVPLPIESAPLPSTSFGGALPRTSGSETEREGAGGPGGSSRSGAGKRAYVPGADHILSVIWVAGRQPPPGLATLRLAQRAEERGRALEEIRTGLAEPGRVARLWHDELERLLRQPRFGEDALWSVAARVVGLLGLHELSGLLALGLDEGTTPGRTDSARDALHTLFGAWFESPAEFAPFLNAVPPDGVSPLLLAEVFSAQELALERLIRLFDHAPALALESLTDLDPRTRAEASEALGQALMRGRLERERVLDALFGRLGSERNADAFHAALQALSVFLESEPFDAPDVVRLRQVLLEGGRLEHTLSIAQALARMAWREEGEPGADHLFAGIDAVGRLIRTHAHAQRRRGILDPDSMMESLLALETLCDRALNAGLGKELRGTGVRTEIILLLRERSNPVAVRVAAAEVLDALAHEGDILMMIGILAESGRSPALGHALLGTLRSVLLQTPLDAPVLDQVLPVIIAQAGATDPDLRRRALALLNEERLAPLVRGVSPEFLLRLLEQEEVADLQRLVIELIARFGEPDMLTACLEMQRFDELASDPNSLPELAEMCRILADGVPSATASAAQRLAGVERAGTRLARLRHALAMIAELDEESAVALAPDLHRRVCAWAWELHRSGTELPLAIPAGMLERLAKVHWPRSAADVQVSVTGRPFDEAARYHLIAVVLGMLAEASADPVDVKAAEDAYRRALLVASTHRGRSQSSDVPGHSDEGADRLEDEVRRDRARFRHAAADWQGAMEDFRLLAARDALSLSDLRTAIEVLRLIGNINEPKAVSVESFDLYRSVLAAPDWPTEPPIIRMQDLRELSVHALRSQNLARSEVLLALLADLPGDVGGLGSLGDSEPDTPRAWTGLTEDEGLFSELEEMRRRHTQAAENQRALRARAAGSQN